MICLREHDKSSNVHRTQLHGNCVAVTLLPKSCHIIPACSSGESSLAPDRSPNWFQSNFLHLKYFPLGLYTKLHRICIYTAWIGRRDLPLQGLSCGLIKHFNISGREEDTGSTCIKFTSPIRFRVPRGEGVGVATAGIGIAVACSVVGYVQVMCSTKSWSGHGTCVNSAIVLTWLDVHLNRSVAINVV